MLDGIPIAGMLAEYYRKRATEYDTLYTAPAWQSELPVLHGWLARHARGRTILEVACGTGYWTAIAAAVAREIVATDINPEMLAIAAARNLGAHVALVQADCWSLPDFRTAFDVGMAHLWWSHVRKQERRRFISHFASRLHGHATVLMIDENLVEGFGMPISRRDAAGNTYQTRWLGNGDRYEIVKNYPDRRELEDCISPICEHIEILQLRHFWALRATVGAGT
jgi:SAM-dependent methyltransferase